MLELHTQKGTGPGQDGFFSGMAAGNRSLLTATWCQGALRPREAIGSPCLSKKKTTKQTTNEQCCSTGGYKPSPVQCFGCSRQLWAVFGTVKLHSVLTGWRGDYIWVLGRTFSHITSKFYLRKCCTHPREMHLLCRSELFFWSTQRPRKGSGSLLFPHY